MCLRSTEKKLLESLVKIQNLLLKNNENDAMWNKILAILGKGANVSRTYIFKNEIIDNELFMSYAYEWCNTGITSFVEDYRMQKLPWVEYSPNVYDHFLNHKPYQNIEKNYDAFEQSMLIDQNIKSVLGIPIYVGKDFYGFMGFDDCKLEEPWYISEINYLKMAINSISIFLKHKESLRTADKSEIKYKNILDLFPDPVMAYNIDGSLKFINKKAAQDIKLPMKKILDMNMRDFIPENDKKLKKLWSERIFSWHEGSTIYENVTENTFDDNLTTNHYNITTKVVYDGKEPDYKISVIRDITDEIKKKKELEELINQKTRLIKEMHHRIKNNLSVVQGLLDLQINSEMEGIPKDDECYVKLNKVIDDAKRRILAISLVHKMFYNYHDGDYIDFSEFLLELIEYLSDIFYIMKDKIKINYKSAKIYLCLDQAIPCGLIVNEIIANAYKYAFIGQDKGEITIELNNCEKDFYIGISDNGIGLPEKYAINGDNESFGNSSSIGFSLIRGLTDQLFGRLIFDTNKNGTKFELHIPKKGM